MNTTTGTPTVHVVGTASEFEALREDWIALRARAGQSLPYDSHRWLLAWWQASDDTGAARTHRVLTVRQDGRLIAAVPLQVERGRFRRLPVRKASAMGGGWGSTALLVDAAHEGAACTALARAFQAGGNGAARWRVLQLTPLRGSATAQAALMASLRTTGLRVRHTVLPQPYLALASSWAEFLSGRSRNFRRTVKRKQQATTEAGLTSRTIHHPDAVTVRDTIERVTSQSWQGEKGVGVMTTPFGRRFYELLSAGRDEFALDLTVMEHAGAPVAFLLGILAGRTYHAFETGFDPRWNEQSPGLMLHFIALERLHAEGASEFDFGYAHGYKDRFDPLSRDAIDLRVFPTAWLAQWERFALWLEARAAKSKVTAVAPEGTDA